MRPFQPYSMKKPEGVSAYDVIRSLVWASLPSVGHGLRLSAQGQSLPDVVETMELTMK